MATLAIAIKAGLLVPGRVLGAWPKEQFEATSVGRALRKIPPEDEYAGASTIIKAPDIAENGAVVPITIKSSLPNAESISILAPDNSKPLVAEFNLGEAAQAYVSTRIKMRKSSIVGVLVQSSTASSVATQAVKITSGSPADDFPSFVWPPPVPSAFMDIKRSLLVSSSSPTLGDVAYTLTSALSKAKYYEYNYYSVPYGYAIVTRIEKINSDASPMKEPERWSIGFQPSSISTIQDYVRALFLGPKGMYRVIVFIVSSQAIIADSGKRASKKQANDWLEYGASKLPKVIENQHYDHKYNCRALIYEFEKKSKIEDAYWVKSKHIGLEHLQQSNIWNNLIS